MPIRYPFRMQYHFRTSEKGLLAWDVHRLVALTEAQKLPIEEVSLEKIAELEETYWFASGHGEGGSGLDPAPTCRAVAEHARLIAEADLAWPIILCAQGRVMDGMHRVCKALISGRKTVAAVRFTETLRPDYIGVSPDDLPY